MRKLSLTLILLLSALCLKGMADTITLKDGSTVEGTITQEDDNQVTINVSVSTSISDERILKRDEIAKIEKTTEDTAAYEKLQGWKPRPWAMLSADEYKNTIAALKDFLQKYPASTHKAEVQKMLDTFQDEFNHQQAGDVKLYGVWLPPAEAAARQSQIQAQTLYLKMEAAGAQGDYIGAMNLFDQLEKTYSGCRAYPAAIERVAKTYLVGLQIDANRARDNLKILDQEWQQGVAITPEPRKTQIMAARQAELKQYDDILAAAQSAGEKWPPFVNKSQKILDAIITLIGTEKPRILALPVDKMNASIARSDKASELISAAIAARSNPTLMTKDLAEADTILKDALLLWPTSEEAMYLQKAVAEITASQAHPETASRIPMLALRPTPKVAGTVTPTPKPTPKPTPVATPPPEEETPQTFLGFFFTIKGALTIVACAVVLLLIASYLQKSKKAAGEDDE